MVRLQKGGAAQVEKREGWGMQLAGFGMRGAMPVTDGRVAQPDRQLATGATSRGGKMGCGL